MSYILSSENCQGVTVRFKGKEDLFGIAYGKRWEGTLSLQDRYDNQSLYRVVFSDLKNTRRAGLRAAVNLGKVILGKIPRLNPNELCHFDFTFEELKTGKKTVNYVVQKYNAFFDIYVLSFRDNRTQMGCNYAFISQKDAQMWAEKLGITRYTEVDENGNVTGSYCL